MVILQGQPQRKKTTMNFELDVFGFNGPLYS